MDLSSLASQLMAQSQPQSSENQALLVLGLQNDFISPDGKLPVPLESGFLERIKILVPKFRELAGHIVWVRSEFQAERLGDAGMEKIIADVDEQEVGPAETPEARENTKKPKSSRKKDKKKGQKRNNVMQFFTGKREPEQNRIPDPEVRPEEDEIVLNKSGKGPGCMAGTPGADFIKEVNEMMRPEDTVLVKSHYSAFNQTNLRLTLHLLGVKDLYIVGCMTNLSVYATAQEAAGCGYHLHIVEDCLGYRTQERHDIALKTMVDRGDGGMAANLTTSTTILADLNDEDEGGEQLQYSSDDRPHEENDLHGLNDALAGLDLGSRDHSSVQSQGLSVSQLTEALGATSLSTGTRRSLITTPAPPRPPTTQPSNGATAFLEARSLRSSKSTPDVRSRAHVRMRTRPRNKAEVPKVPRLPQATGSSSNSTRPQDNLENVTRTNQLRDTEGELTKKPSEAPNVSLSSRKQHEINSNNTPELISTQEISRSTIEVPKKTQVSQDLTDDMAKEVASSQHEPTKQSFKKPTFKSLANLPSLGPDDEIGEGDSCIKYDLLPADLRDDLDPTLPLSDTIFRALYHEVDWQKMYHAAGEVPRLVAVQGTLDKDGSKPVYRHPSDQAPPLSSFTKHVNIVRRQAEELVGHPLNHVLIQLYRTGNDYISEHSDKTLDIARGSSIVNASFGAQRTMRLRTKKSGKKVVTAPEPAESTAKDATSPERQTQRIHMPHNSLFVLGLETNRIWLHGITQDKRLPQDRSPAELANNSMRISLTFRNIATFLSADEKLIWGQGAKNKSREEAREVINANDEESEKLIDAFGFENKEGAGFVWEDVYGSGFDVLNMRKAATALGETNGPNI